MRMIVFLSVMCSVFLFYGFIELYCGLKKIKTLKNITLKNITLDASVQDKISIILVAKDEEKHIKQSIDSLLKQDYSNIEVIVINDRSTDNTAHILQASYHQNPAVTLKEISHLPKGWLGKNHAMYEGAKLAAGKWLLFLDADVLLESDALSKAMVYMKRNDCTHLTLIPEFKTNRFLIDLIICSGSLAFYFRLKPWRCHQKNKKFYFGIGAFNILKASDYFQFDGHHSFPLCILDDMKLAKQLKRYGAKQHCLEGTGLIAMNWYETITDVILGTEKNSFAYCNFKFSTLLIESLLGIFLFISPLVIFFSTEGYAQFFSGLAIFITMSQYAFYCQLRDMSQWYLILYPLGVLIGTYSWWRSALKITYNQGVYWRETFYSLSELKKDLL